MTEFLAVVPPNYLEKIRSQERFENIGFFLLAHEVVKDPEAYRAILPLIRANLTILDNSAIELGKAVDISMVMEAALICKPDVIVLPDALEKADETIQLVLDGFEEWSDTFTLSELMFVPQGESMRDWVRCLETVMFELARDGVVPEWIGIPRNTTQRICISRTELVNIVHTLFPQQKIHLLGFSDYVWDDLVSAKYPAVMSIDSAAPFRQEQFMAFEQTKGRGHWWDEVKGLSQEQIPEHVLQTAERLDDIMSDVDDMAFADIG